MGSTRRGTVVQGGWKASIGSNGSGNGHCTDAWTDRNAGIVSRDITATGTELGIRMTMGMYLGTSTATGTRNAHCFCNNMFPL